MSWTGAFSKKRAQTWILTTGSSRQTLGTSCCSWTWWQTSSSCHSDEGQWCRPPQRAWSPAPSTSAHWQPPLRDGDTPVKEVRREREERAATAAHSAGPPFTLILCSPLGCGRMSTHMTASPTASTPDAVQKNMTVGCLIVFRCQDQFVYNAMMHKYMNHFVWSSKRSVVSVSNLRLICCGFDPQPN